MSETIPEDIMDAAESALEWEEAGEPVKWKDIRSAFAAAIRNAGESK